MFLLSVTRGLDPEKAVSMKLWMASARKGVLKKFQMEFAVEAGQLLEISLERLCRLGIIEDVEHWKFIEKNEKKIKDLYQAVEEKQIHQKVRFLDIKPGESDMPLWAKWCGKATLGYVLSWSWWYTVKTVCSGNA